MIEAVCEEEAREETADVTHDHTDDEGCGVQTDESRIEEENAQAVHMQFLKNGVLQEKAPEEADDECGCAKQAERRTPVGGAVGSGSGHTRKEERNEDYWSE